MSGITPSQTLGPFPHEGWRWAFDAGDGPVVLRGQVLDGEGQPVPDAMIEAWAPAGRPRLLRVPSGEQGEFAFALPAAPAGEPLAYVTVFARGLLKHQFTAVFPADAAGLARAPLLVQVPAERRATLFAQPAGERAYLWDIRLQGPQETVFLDCE